LIKINPRLFKNNQRSILSFLLFTLTVIFITYLCFRINMDIGPIWDTYDLLADAALFSGKSIGYFDLIRPPVMSILTSLYFRLDGLAIWPIMFIDGLIFILGSIGLYLVFKLRFDDLNSFLGALLFVSFPITLTFAARGLTDLPSICIAICGLLFTLMAVKKDSRFFCMALPILMIAFLTRFSTALVIFPIFLYILMNKNEIKSFKDILIGILISILIITPFTVFFYMDFGNPLNIFLDFFQTSSASLSDSAVASMGFFYNTDFFYYAKLIPEWTWPEGLYIFIIIIIGLISFILRILRKVKNKRINLNHRQVVTSKKIQLLENQGKLKLILSIIFLLTFIFTLQKVHYLLSELLFFCFLYCLYELVKIYKVRNLDFDFLFISWFMAFFIFHSLYVVKDFRYLIGMAPPIAYFLIRGFTLATSQLRFNIKGKSITQLLAPLLILLTLLSLVAYLPTLPETNVYLKEMNDNSFNLSIWLVNYDPEYKTKVIYSDNWPYTAWYLQRNVSKMPSFRDNQVLYTGAKNYDFTKNDMMEYNRELDDNNVDYYFSRRAGLNLTNYKLIKQIDDFILYEKIK
jgi:hypothetical protein